MAGSSSWKLRGYESCSVSVQSRFLPPFHKIGLPVPAQLLSVHERSRFGCRFCLLGWLTQLFMAIFPTWDALSGLIVNFANEDTAALINPERVSSPVAAPPVPSPSRSTPPTKNDDDNIVSGAAQMNSKLISWREVKAHRRVICEQRFIFKKVFRPISRKKRSLEQ